MALWGWKQRPQAREDGRSCINNQYTHVVAATSFLRKVERKVEYNILFRPMLTLSLPSMVAGGDIGSQPGKQLYHWAGGGGDNP